jgi:hypothetical protein
MEEMPKRYAPKFKEEFAKAENRFVAEFLFHFSKEDGGIHWEKLAEMNSGRSKCALAQYKAKSN